MRRKAKTSFFSPFKSGQSSSSVYVGRNLNSGLFPSNLNSVKSVNLSSDHLIDEPFAYSLRGHTGHVYSILSYRDAGVSDLFLLTGSNDNTIRSYHLS